MARIMAIDFGKRRIGTAISDPFGTFASALETIDGRDLDFAISRIRGLVTEHGVAELVVGLPLRTDGSVGPEAEKCQSFARKLQEKLKLPVNMQDERFTTVEAHHSMQAMGADGRKRRGSVDRVAAALILQSFLDRRAAERRREEESWQ